MAELGFVEVMGFGGLAKQASKLAGIADVHEASIFGRGGDGGEGGIPSSHPKKFSVAMVKPNFFVVNEQIVEKPFCQCHWKI